MKKPPAKSPATQSPSKSSLAATETPPASSLAPNVPRLPSAGNPNTPISKPSSPVRGSGISSATKRNPIPF